MLIERIILLAGISLSIVLFVSFFKRQQFNKARTAASEINRLQVIYFWSTHCSQCISVQTPIIENLIATFGKDKLSINKYNVSDTPELAKNGALRRYQQPMC